MLNSRFTALPSLPTNAMYAKQCKEH